MMRHPLGQDRSKQELLNLASKQQFAQPLRFFDNSSTTCLDPEVLRSMEPFFCQFYGNASSEHAFGKIAREAVESARSKIAALIAAKKSDIFFTSGATESNNLVLKGLTEVNPGIKRHIIVSSIEHNSVLSPCKHIENKGYRLTYLSPKSDGLIYASELEKHICDDTLLVSIMHANNEIGSVNPISAIGKLCRNKGVWFHTDAAQSAGSEAIDVTASSIDFLSLSAHKIYGPKGIGALYANAERGCKLAPQIHGGNQESGMRSGTLNVPAIVGFGKATELVKQNRQRMNRRNKKWQDYIIHRLKTDIPSVKVNGHLSERLPHHLSLTLPVRSSTVQARMANFMFSRGSACHSKSASSSHVLKAIGLTDSQAENTVRLSFGRFMQDSDIEALVSNLIRAVANDR